jgi:DNA-binding XRE family transcriptional regulator
MASSKILRVKPEWFLTEHKDIQAALPKNSGVFFPSSFHPEDFYAPLRFHLRQHREDRNWTQEQLAEELRKRGKRMSNQRISLIEDSDQNASVTVDLLKEFAQVFQTTMHRLLHQPQ